MNQYEIKKARLKAEKRLAAVELELARRARPYSQAKYALAVIKYQKAKDAVRIFIKYRKIT